MIAALRNYGKESYAGLLARAALSVTDNITSKQKKIVVNEEEIIQSILKEIAQANGLQWPSEESIPGILEAIDAELDKNIPDSNERDALRRLAERAELPSDLYEVTVIKNIADFYGAKFNDELARIIETVKRPEKELHYGPPEAENQPFLISLFSRHFEDKYPRNSFTLLVVGQRDGLKMIIHQAWRIYPDIIPETQIHSLLELLKAFSDVFGIEMEMNGQRGKFLLADTSQVNQSFNVKIETPRNKEGKPVSTSFTFSHFIQNKPNSLLKQASLWLAIDLERYKALLAERKW